MDARPPDQDYDDQSYVEFEITDIDVDENGQAGTRSAESSIIMPLFSHIARHSRLWFSGAIVIGCVMICLLLFPDIASFISPLVLQPMIVIGTPTFKPDRVDVYPGSNDVTLVMGVQTDAQFVHMTNVSVTAYDTQSGTLLWHTPQIPSSTITYGRVVHWHDQDVIDIYARRSDGLISLLAPRTGKVLWEYKIPTLLSFSYENDDIFFFQDVNNTIYAVKDGRLLWRNATLGNIFLFADGVIYSYNSAQKSYTALSESSGKRFWSYAAPALVQPSTPGTSSTVMENNTLYFQTVDNTLRALQLNGQVLWTHKLEDPVNLVVDTHHLYVIDPLASALDVFDLQKGNLERAYRNELGAITIMDVQNDLLYIRVPEGVRVVDANTGKMVWQYKTSSINQPMYAVNGVIYLLPIDGTNQIQALDERNGTLRWSITTQEQVSSSDNEVLNLQSLDFSILSVLRLSDGKILWNKHIFFAD